MPHIKGTSLIPIVKLLRNHHDAATAALPEGMQSYLTDRVLQSSWYPEEDYKVLLLTVGRMLEPFVRGDVWEYIGIEGAKSDLTSVHASIVRKGDPWRTLKRSQMIWSLYHDSGHLSAEAVTTEEARMTLSDYAIACPEVCATIAGYLRQLLVLCRAQVFEARVLDCPPAESGPTLFRLRFKA